MNCTKGPYMKWTPQKFEDKGDVFVIPIHVIDFL